MIIPVDKEKTLNEFKEKYVENRYEEEVPKIYERFDSNREDIKEQIISDFKKVCSCAIDIQEKDLKGEIQYIYISFLRTNIIENKGTYRIDLYDDKWFLDKEECFSDINLSFIFEPLFLHINELEAHKKEYGHNVTSMDIERIKLEEGDKYHKLAIEILESIINDFLECDQYKVMKKHEEIMILAGEYRDEVISLHQKNK